MARSKSSQLSLEDMLETLRDGIKSQAKRPNIHAYRPHAKQEIFHKSSAKKKLYIGGNRSGKTTSAVVEDIYWLRGQHPDRPVPEPPIRGRVVGVDFLDGINKIIIPEFQRWTPPSLLKNGSWEDSYNREMRTLTFANKSTVEFMSYEQETAKFAGTSRHFTHYDEEPPKNVFDECNARLVDTNGSYWISMTPVEGMTWVYETLFVPGTEDPDSSILVIQADMLDNPYISREAAESFLSGLDKEERDAREHGTFVRLGGKVYKIFNKEIHTRPPVLPPRDWRWYTSLDHGYNNPTAVLWHAVSPNGGEVITFDEHYASEMIVSEHAKAIKEKNKAHDKEPYLNVCDPALAQRQGVTGTSIQTEYAINGIYLALGNNDVSTGVAKVQQYLRTNPKTGRPYWTITENCTNLIRQMGNLRWKTYSSKKVQFQNNPQEQIHKKDDHSADAARYFFSFMPDLAFEEIAPPVNHEALGFGKPGSSPTGLKIDEVMAKILQNSGPGSDATKWNIKNRTDLGSLEYE